MRGVLAPGAKCVLQPEQRKDGKERSDKFVEQLFQGKPEPAKSPSRGRLTGDGLRGSSHGDILAPVAKTVRKGCESFGANANTSPPFHSTSDLDYTPSHTLP